MLFLLRRLAPAFVCAVFAFAALPASAQGSGADGPVTLLVPYPAGGGSDFTARVVGPALARTLSTTVVVENLGGATGAIAIQKVLNAPADGRLLYQGSQNEMIIPPLTIKSVRFHPEDLEIVHPITTTRLVLVVRKDLAARDLQEFLALARQDSASHPLSYGSPGIGSLYHLIPESMARLSGVHYNHIPYKGAAPMLQDLIGGRIDFTVMAFSTAMLAAEKAGHYRILANLSRDKPQQLAQLPSVSEIEMFRTVDYASNAGYFVRKGTPVAIKERLNKAIGDALAGGAVAAQLEADGRRVPHAMSLAAAEAFYRDEVAKYRRIVAETGFKPLD